VEVFRAKVEKAVSKEAVIERREVLLALIEKNLAAAAELEAKICNLKHDRRCLEGQVEVLNFALDELSVVGVARGDPERADDPWLGLSPAAARKQKRNFKNEALATIREHPGFTLQEIAKHIGGSVERIGNAVAKLVRDGELDIQSDSRGFGHYRLPEDINELPPQPSEIPAANRAEIVSGALAAAQADIVRSLFERAGANGLGEDAIDSPARKDGLMALIAKGEAEQRGGRYYLVSKEAAE
jgi:hypothetical protein